MHIETNKHGRVELNMSAKEALELIQKLSAAVIKSGELKNMPGYFTDGCTVEYSEGKAVVGRVTFRVGEQ